MKVKVAKWGNSLGVRLPKRFSDELGLTPGSIVDLQREGTRFAIETATARQIPRYKLEDLLARIKPGAVPAYEDWGILPSEWPGEDWSDIAPQDGPAAPPRRKALAAVRQRKAGRRATGRH